MGQLGQGLTAVFAATLMYTCGSTLMHTCGSTLMHDTCGSTLMHTGGSTLMHTGGRWEHTHAYRWERCVLLLHQSALVLQFPAEKYRLVSKCIYSITVHPNLDAGILKSGENVFGFA